MPRTTSPARISRRTVAAGAAWATPVVAVAAAAPALASSCATGPSDIYFGYKWVCGGLNSDTCEYVIQMNSLTTCGTGGIPSGTKVTITMTNTSPNADTVTVNSTGTTWKVDSASGSGVVTPTERVRRRDGRCRCHLDVQPQHHHRAARGHRPVLAGDAVGPQPHVPRNRALVEYHRNAGHRPRPRHHQ